MTQHVYIAELFPANGSSFDAMVRGRDDDMLGENDGWSAPVWVRLANGNLILGCLPLGMTYEEQEPWVAGDHGLAEAAGDSNWQTVPMDDLGTVDLADP